LGVHPLIRFRDIHGYWRAFRMAGSGPPLLLIHGIGDSSETWLKVIPELARRHTVIAPDLLGHGESAKPRADYAVAAYACGMRDLLSVLDVDRVTVVGHSLGGGIAMQFAYQFPERCERLVLVGSGGIGQEVHPLLRIAAAPAAQQAERDLCQQIAAQAVGHRIEREAVRCGHRGVLVARGRTGERGETHREQQGAEDDVRGGTHRTDLDPLGAEAVPERGPAHRCRGHRGHRRHRTSSFPAW
jgi:pimeloyl-ACP methyl ester carboxylesterase